MNDESTRAVANALCILADELLTQVTDVAEALVDNGCAEQHQMDQALEYIANV